MDKPLLGIFPSFFKHLSVEELRDACLRAGLDAVNAVVRTGYWIEPDRLKEMLPGYVKIARSNGLKVSFATTPYGPVQLVQHPEMLSILADNGIEQFRMASYGVPEDRDVRGAVDRARVELSELEPYCRKAGVQAILQLHGGAIHSSFTAAYRLLEGLDPACIAAEPDPGNQMLQDGHELWRYGFSLLREYCAAMGVKDVVMEQNQSLMDSERKGWRGDWISCRRGMINWDEVIKELKNIGFSNQLIFMPFYHRDNFDKLMEVFIDEVAYIRGIVDEVYGG